MSEPTTREERASMLECVGDPHEALPLTQHLAANEWVPRLIADLTVAEARVTALEEALLSADSHLIYWWEMQHGCPCGARPESPQSHPHVPLCPTEQAILRRAALKEGTDAPQQPPEHDRDV